MRRLRETVTVVGFGLVLIVLSAGTASATACPVSTDCAAVPAVDLLSSGLGGLLSVLVGLLGGGGCPVAC